MLIIFRRTQLPAKTDKPPEIRVIADGVIEGEHRKIGELLFPNSTSWSRFWGAIQRGALQVKELEVKLENLPLEEKEATPTLGRPGDPKNGTSAK